MHKLTKSFPLALVLAALVSMASGAIASPTHTAEGFEQEKVALEAWAAKDCQRALPMLRDLALRNATEHAHSNYGLALVDGRCGVNHREAAPFFQLCVDNNGPQIADCLNELGQMYGLGKGVAFDEYRGEEYLRRGADMGHAAAARNLTALRQARANYNAGQGQAQAPSSGRGAPPPTPAPRATAAPKPVTCYWVSGNDGFPGYRVCN